MLLKILLLTALISSVLSYKTFKGVIVADDSNFEDIIYAKGKYTLVNFYSKTCQHCQKLGPKYEPLVDLFNNTKIQIVQLEGRENKRIRKQEKIIGFPTLRLYSFDGSHMGSFVDERSTENLAKFITDHTGVQPNWPEQIIKQISSINELKKLNQIKPSIVVFLAPWLDEWNGRYSIFEKIAKIYSNDYNFIRIDSTSEESSDLTNLYKIDKFPTLMKFNQKELSTNFQILNKDDINKESIENFINDDDIGKKYKDLNQLINEKLLVDDENDDNFQLKKGFNVYKNQGDYKNEEEEEERYRKLREL
ncbi:putative secreted protein [Wickerhamomyces ciferrii]|uniref:Secreted protein n=1 Tax=Wickerhamomyces ciferrii (strain ATCC 14091 / BCRC 22168 / CBS 111 / JCM 3599 / NBRC 0793 / NRRL Y-1031 F-60-10) TaxID=1206466 RepID=K0KAQ8_WICCF|nr:uncharacterized protein BN7_1619 [Wickerhamomyces ciferrii]CCH42080.1 putative secreted protein [Wickerhamomyces ciferrii]